jgi:hypothetical protein
MIMRASGPIIGPKLGWRGCRRGEASPLITARRAADMVGSPVVGLAIGVAPERLFGA